MEGRVMCIEPDLYRTLKWRMGASFEKYRCLLCSSCAQNANAITAATMMQIMVALERVGPFRRGRLVLYLCPVQTKIA